MFAIRSTVVGYFLCDTGFDQEVKLWFDIPLRTKNGRSIRAIVIAWSDVIVTILVSSIQKSPSDVPFVGNDSKLHLVTNQESISLIG